MPVKSAPNTRRNGDLAMVHMAAKRLFGDVSRGGDGRAAYEDWLERLTGQRSAAKLSLDARIELIKRLHKDGLVPDRGRGGAGRTVGGADRPTSAQWAKIGGLSRSMGWKGLEDPALKAFVKRTAKVEDTRFLTRQQASAVILGMEEWLKSKNQSVTKT
ncbi:MAG: regulatory protein GemA [Paracoccus sp. (in: a-proteobacteria)]|nr:regulatory protein GemA [Paracoccus sp. (in: a-proteobacteria)]